MSLRLGNQIIPNVTVRLSSSGVTNYQVKTITPSTSVQNVVADSGFDALSKVTVNAIQTETKTVTTNGTVTPSSGKYLTSVTVNVPVGSTINNQNKTVTPTTSQQSITADSGYTGLGTVTVNRIPTNYLIPSGNKSITANGTNIDVSQYATVSVNVATGSTINNQNKTVTPSTSQQSITADSGYTGLGTVTVNAMPTMTLPTAATASATSGFSSKATIGRSTADQYINIPTGYNSAGAYYKISAVANGSVNNPTASKGTVSNNSISIIPSVTSTTGYITGGTKTGTAVTVSASELVSGTLSITSNGTKDVTNYANVNVNISGDSPTIETLTVTPSESEQTFNSSSVDGYKPVTVGAISNDYVGSGILRTSAIIPYSIGTHTDTYYVINMVPIDNFYFTEAAPAWVPKNYFGTATAAQVLSGATFTSASGLAIEGTIESKSSTDITVSGATVNVPAGYYSEAASKSVASGTTTAPTSISGTAASVSTGTNTLTLTKTVSVTPRVTTAGYISSGTAGNASVTLTANVTTKGAATITPGTSNQTIASGTYLTGIQTIAGDSDLVAANIKSGVQIFNITGTFTNDATSTAADILSGKTAYASGTKLTGTLNFITVYTGTSTPSSSLGVNGDIYIQS